MKVFLQLYSASLNSDLSPRAKLLTLVPALESLHGQKYGTGEYAIDAHKARRKSVLRRVRKLKICADDYRFLLRWLDSRGAYTLPDRLRALYDSLAQDIRATMDSRILPIPASLAGIHSSPRDVWDAIGRLRNDLAHGGAPHTSAEVASAVRLCQKVATALILAELGIPNTLLCEAIEREQWRPI